MVGGGGSSGPPRNPAGHAPDATSEKMVDLIMIVNGFSMNTDERERLNGYRVHNRCRHLSKRKRLSNKAESLSITKLELSYFSNKKITKYLYKNNTPTGIY